MRAQVTRNRDAVRGMFSNLCRILRNAVLAANDTEALVRPFGRERRSTWCSALCRVFPCDAGEWVAFRPMAGKTLALRNSDVHRGGWMLRTHIPSPFSFTHRITPLGRDCGQCLSSSVFHDSD